MKIRITRTIRLQPIKLKKVIAELLPINGPMNFIEESVPLRFEDNNFKWDIFFEKCTEFRNNYSIPQDDFLVVLTELSNDMNWFSSISTSGERTIFVQVSGWENYIYAESEFPVAYEVVANILQLLSFEKHGDEIFKYLHNEPLGCMNDMCSWKPDITFKLRTGDICSDCLSLMSSIIDNEIIEQAVAIFELLRIKMLFNRGLQKIRSFEENLPFSIAITKRKLASTMEPFRKMLMLIDHFDSIVRTAVLMIGMLTKTKEQMQDFLEERNLSNLPSLGHWVDALAAVNRGYAGLFPEVPLPKDFSTNVQQVVQIANDAKIILMRNERRGHGYIECQDSGYKEYFLKCLPAVESIEQLLSPLFYRFKYYHIISSRRIQGNRFNVSVHDLSGSNPAFIEKEIVAEFTSVDEIPIEDSFYLVTPDLFKWVELSPYFKYATCYLCSHSRFLVFDGIYMLDPYIGHRFKI